MIRNPYITSKKSNPVASLASASISTSKQDNVRLRGVAAYPLSLHPFNRNCSKLSPTTYDANMKQSDKTTSAKASLSIQSFPKDLPVIDRLPSRNVSFSCAELLTISELTQSFVGKNMIDESKSVRVTGTILYIDKNAQWFLLSDPLVKLKQKPLVEVPVTNTRSTLVNKRGVKIDNGDNAGENKNMSNKYNEQNKNPYPSRSMPPSLLGKKRKIVTIKRNRTSMGLGLLPEEKHSFRTKISTNPPTQEKLVYDLVNKRKRDYEDAKLLGVDLSYLSASEKCSVGDLVMIIGEVKAYSWGTNVKSAESIAHAAKFSDDKKVMDSKIYRGKLHFNLKDALCLLSSLQTDLIQLSHSSANRKCTGVVMDVQLFAEEGSEEDGTRSNTSHHQHGIAIRRNGYVQARIVRNASGTDMKLLQDALMLRRKYLKQQNNSLINATNDSDANGIS